MKKLIGLVVLMLSVGTANAAMISFTGSFDSDDTRFYADFEVTAQSLVTLSSLGYAGGINGEGTIIADGGFDSQLFLFDSSSSLLESNDDDSDTVSASSGLSWDAFISRVLDPGTYTVVLTQYNNDFLSGDLVTGVWSGSGRSNFVDTDGNQRNDQYAFDISGDFITNVGGFDNDVQVPVSPTALLLCLGLVGFVAARKK